MEYRKLPHGTEMISTIGLGLGSIHQSASEEEIEAAVRFALDNGINFFDLCCGRVSTFAAVGRAIKGRRDKAYTQMHFGAVYTNDEYGFGRDLDTVKASFEKVLKASELGYTDFGYIHCIDEEDDFNDVMRPGGIFDYIRSLKAQGIVRHMGCSTHTPSIARRFIETGEVDMFMFSINPAYDYAECEYGYGAAPERAELYAFAQQNGIGISVMKPFAAGQMLDEKSSPLSVALTREQCIQYALDRPAVLCVLPGVCGLENVKEVLGFYSSSREQRDYSALGSAIPRDSAGRCVYCNHCAPCPMGIDVGLVNKYYDLAKFGDEMAKSHYYKLSTHAEACVQCGHCESRCPFGVAQISRMEQIKEYFGE